MQYKKLTEQIRDGICALVDQEFKLVSVNDFARACDYFHHRTVETLTGIQSLLNDGRSDGRSDVYGIVGNKMQNIRLPYNLLRSIGDCVELRTVMMARYTKNNDHGQAHNMDDGHMHMIDVLKYCKSILSHCKSMYRAVFRKVESLKELEKNIIDSQLRI